uniref:AB hydrolase-1 domain-containing protein n=1 Tax=Sphaeramia orbicularis TaxID=375764 RepID=A0A673B6H1_9TELE
MWPRSHGLPTPDLNETNLMKIKTKFQIKQSLKLWVISLRFPLMADLSRPENFLNHTRNFYLHAEGGVTLGVWHTLAASQWEEAHGGSPEWYRETLADDNPVIIYLHGNEGTRWDECGRKETLELILMDAAGYHVLSLDYRGFGDSSGEPSEAGLTTDVVSLYQWVKKYSRQSPVYLWGHSLGTGSVYKIVFCVPFITAYIPFIFLCSLKTLTCPLLLLHAKDDSVVPYQMGVKLYQIALATHRERNEEAHVQMISYSADLGYSHSKIHMDPNLSHVVR